MEVVSCGWMRHDLLLTGNAVAHSRCYSWHQVPFTRSGHPPTLLQKNCHQLLRSTSPGGFSKFSPTTTTFPAPPQPQSITTDWIIQNFKGHPLCPYSVGYLCGRPTLEEQTKTRLCWIIHQNKISDINKTYVHLIESLSHSLSKLEIGFSLWWPRSHNNNSQFLESRFLVCLKILF